MKILALKVSELRRQQPAIALDIPLMAQDFLGSISIIVVAASSAKVTIPFGWWWQGLPRRARYNMGIESQDGESVRRSGRLAPGVRRATVADAKLRAPRH